MHAPARTRKGKRDDRPLARGGPQGVRACARAAPALGAALARMLRLRPAAAGHRPRVRVRHRAPLQRRPVRRHRRRRRRAAGRQPAGRADAALVAMVRLPPGPRRRRRRPLGARRPISRTWPTGCAGISSARPSRSRSISASSTWSPSAPPRSCSRKRRSASRRRSASAPCRPPRCSSTATRTGRSASTTGPPA